MSQQQLQTTRTASLGPVSQTTYSGADDSHNVQITSVPGANGDSFVTLVNSIFASNREECYRTYSTTCADKALPCLFEFNNSCTPKNDDLVYGTYCLRHTNATNRTYIPIGSQTSVDMQPIYIRPATCENNMFLWSFITNVSYAKAKLLASFMDISVIESQNLAKFISILSERHDGRDNTAEFQRLKQYLSIYCEFALKSLESVPDRDKILVPVYMSNKFVEDNKKNQLVQNIQAMMKRNELTHQAVDTSTHLVYIPLNMFNLLDQINFLSFRMYCGVGQISLAPNCSVNGLRVVIGTGLSIKNALSPVDITKLKSHYSDQIYRTIRNIHGDTVHNNYDVLVLLVVPGSTGSTISPQIFIANRRYVNSYFDIEQLHSPMLC